MTHKYLLAIDGGGLRGIIPLSVLVKLEQTTGKLARDTFHFIGGTSAGAIIAAGIAAGVPAEEVLERYICHARTVFRRSPLNLPRRLLFGYMYSTQTLHDVLADSLGDARDWTLNDSTIDILITAKRLDGKPWYFVRDHECNAKTTGQVRLVDCVTASAAAPTYFEPWQIPRIGELVDGGVGVAGNPVYQLCVEAFFFHKNYDPDQTTVVSLGTGRFLNQRRPRNIIQWFRWLLSELLRSPGEQQTEIVQRHYPQIPFYRIDTALEHEIGLDDVSQIDTLLRHGAALAAETDWSAILADEVIPSRVHAYNTHAFEYCRPPLPS